MRLIPTMRLDLAVVVPESVALRASDRTLTNEEASAFVDKLHACFKASVRM